MWGRKVDAEWEVRRRTCRCRVRGARWVQAGRRTVGQWWWTRRAGGGSGWACCPCGRAPRYGSDCHYGFCSSNACLVPCGYPALSLCPSLCLCLCLSLSLSVACCRFGHCGHSARDGASLASLALLVCCCCCVCHPTRSHCHGHFHSHSHCHCGCRYFHSVCHARPCSPLAYHRQHCHCCQLLLRPSLPSQASPP